MLQAVFLLFGILIIAMKRVKMPSGYGGTSLPVVTYTTIHVRLLMFCFAVIGGGNGEILIRHIISEAASQIVILEGSGDYESNLNHQYLLFEIHFLL